MKLLFVYRFCGLGGVETSILNKITALQKQGIKADALFSEFYGTAGHLFSNHPNVTVTTDKRKIKLLLSKGYDAISVIDYPAFLDTLEELHSRTPVIFESHASFPPALEYFYSKVNHSRISAIVVPSLFNKRLIERAVVTSKKIVVIPNTIDTEFFFFRSSTSIQTRFRQLATGPMILWVGRLEDEKKPTEFIQIAQGILESRKDAHVLVIGDTFNYSEYKSRLDLSIRDELQNRFTFYQSVPYKDMPEIYSLAAETGGCLVSTSLYESAPMTFLEAMACGCPVISSDVGGVNEIITNDVTGRLYRSGQIDHGIATVIDLISPEKMSVRKKLIDNSLQEVLTKRSLLSVGQKYYELLDIVKSDIASVAVDPTESNCITSEFIPGLVSTIIPVYNRSLLLKEAVASVLSQTYKNIEIIIVDDGSTDDTADTCDQLALENRNVKAIHIEHKGRPGLVREAGRLAARGEYIQYLDSDDLLFPEKFEKMVAALEQNPECGIAYCYTRRYPRGETPTDVPIELTGETFHTMLPAFLGRRFWLTPTPLYRKTVCDKAGAWSGMPFWEDIEYDIRIAITRPLLVHCKEFLTDIRDHEMSRLSRKGIYDDPQRLSEATKAVQTIYEHLKNFGISNQDENLGFFVADVCVLYHRCRELNMARQAQVCADIIMEVTGIENADQIERATVRAVIDPQVVVLNAHPGEKMRTPVRVVNQSTVTFRPGEFAFELSYHLLAVDGTVLAFENPRTLIEKPLRPGEERIIDLFIRAPEAYGFYFLEIDIVWGQVTWFKWEGNPAPLVKLVVGENLRQGRWWLRVHEGNEARLIFPSDAPERIRLGISKNEPNNSWHIQLNFLPVPVKKGHRYTVNFLARSDGPRTFNVAVSKAHAPWDGLGLYCNVDVTPEWQPFHLDFEATGDDIARVHFDVGNDSTAIELTSLRVLSAAENQPIEPSTVSFLRRLQMDIGVRPLSYQWGTDRGVPIHRYYLEQFLQENAVDIRGHCLEFQNPQYTPHFGGSAVSKLDILHVDDSNPLATLIADLTKTNSIPSNQFDCIVCTHVLHIIWDLQKALSELHRILKPGGVLLVAVPHVSMCDPAYGEIWRFTPEGLRLLLAHTFDTSKIVIRSYGNSLSAAGEIRGMVMDDFLRSELDFHDSRFAVEVCARVVK